MVQDLPLMRRLRMNHPSAVLKNYSKATGNKRAQVTVIATVCATMAMKANDSIRMSHTLPR